MHQVLNKKTKLLLVIFLLSGCNSMELKQFEGTTPVFNLADYFSGTTYAWGIFEDRFGNLRRQFEVHIDGQYQNDTLVLDERFVYADGEQQQRIWRIEQQGSNRYRGSADDVIGLAEGDAVGNALHWRYEMLLPVGDRHWKVRFDDWMWLQPGGVLINRATVSKWGVTLGTVTLFFSKQAPQP